MKREGRLLWSGAAEQRLPPASLTKLMTALLVLERGGLDELVVVSRGASRETGTRIGLKAGENLRVRDLLAAMVIRSANDACRALADHVSTAFVFRMNQRAEKLGLRNTRFTDPCGHDSEGQYSTAADLARLAERVMQHQEYLRLARLPRLSIATLDGGRRIAFHNTNALIGRYDGALGLKTGYTERAGNCLVALAERDGVRVLAVMLNSPHRWWSAVGLLNHAFDATGR